MIYIHRRETRCSQVQEEAVLHSSYKRILLGTRWGDQLSARQLGHQMESRSFRVLSPLYTWHTGPSIMQSLTSSPPISPLAHSVPGPCAVPDNTRRTLRTFALAVLSAQNTLPPEGSPLYLLQAFAPTQFSQ